MANKITCTCGHSWNKSDSSKKDATVCHICGKNNMKDGGWLDAYDDVPQAENGIEGTMGGLTDVGFNYNGAWGGTMQMGGAMPGSVGFMYARTGAPNNGPYAKKTKASAQNGKEMKYYQAGLDFKPKTISQDGSEIPVDPMGYWNPENVGNPVIIPSNEITMEGVDQPLIGISDTGDVQYMYPGEDYTFDGESVTEYPVAQKGISVSAPTRADSILLLKNAMLKNAFYKNNPNYTTQKSSFNFKDPKLLQKLAQSSVDTNLRYIRYTSLYKNSDKLNKPDELDPTGFKITGEDIKRRTGKVAGSSNVYSAPDIISGKDIDTYFNPTSPPIFFSPSILPQGAVTYHSTKSSGYGDVAESPYYDPLAVSPWDMLTPQQQEGRLKQYGISGTPYDSPKQSLPPPVKTTPTQKPKPKPKPVVYRKPESKKEVKKPEPVKKEELKPIERKQNVYEGSPVYSPGAGSGMGSALVGFLNKQGDTTYIKPEDYERFAVPKYGKEFIESKKKQRNGGVNKADEYPIEKLDQSLNFTNYNKPTKGGWLDKYN